MSPEPGSLVRLYTIGHSTRSFAEFAALLDAHGIGQVADVRTIPRSHGAARRGAPHLPVAFLMQPRWHQGRLKEVNPAIRRFRNRKVK